MTLLDTDLPAASPGPQGEAERWTDDEIALLALLLLSDVQRAPRLWDQLAPKPYRGLLLAVPIDDVRSFRGTLPPLWFDVYSQRYGLGARGTIKQKALFGAVEAFREAAEKRQAAAMRKVYAGELEIGEWQAATADELKVITAASAAAGVGGTGQMTGETLISSSAVLLFHQKRLRKFAVEIENGQVIEPRAVKRAAMYPASVITDTFDDMRRQAHIAVEITEESNVLDPGADHCLPAGGRPGCVEVTERGWVPIGELPLPGRRACSMMCRCHLSYRRRLEIRETTISDAPRIITFPESPGI